VKPAPFAYADPDTLDGVLDLLADGRDAAVIAGGQSLVPLLNLRLARPELVVDPRRVTGLDGIEWDDDGVRIGALTTAATLAADGALASAIPGLVEAVRCIGHPPIRTRTTVGGSVAHADPVAELPTVLVALDATIELASRARGRRTVAAPSFFTGPFTTARGHDELVVAVTIPRPSGPTGWMEHARRPGDFALVGVAAAVSGDRARLAIGGLAGAPILLPDVAVHDVAAPVAALPAPPDDLHGSGAYRVALAAELARRLVARLTA
jgi:carbon-monoxide dehydrogenase medium subunit